MKNQCLLNFRSTVVIFELQDLFNYRAFMKTWGPSENIEQRIFIFSVMPIIIIGMLHMMIAFKFLANIQPN